ncbi:MAG: hypothetical protein HWE30_13170 [Methylocystaceae bacterium]|nr:hypothetical protein [Methylocystaceae bacterium]
MIFKFKQVCLIPLFVLILSGPSRADGLLDQIADNAVYKLKTTYTVFKHPVENIDVSNSQVSTLERLLNRTFNRPSSTDLDNSRRAIYSTLNMETEAILTEDDFYSWVNLDLVAMFGTLPQVGRGVFRHPNDEQAQAHWLDAKRVAYHAEVMDGDAELIVGKELISLGLNEIYSPTDRFGMAVAVDPSEAEEHGVWQMGFKFFSEDDRFEYRFIPFHERGAVANGKNRWQGLMSQTGEVVVAPFQWRNVGNLISYNAVRQGYDWFVLAHHGQAAYPVPMQGRNSSISGAMDLPDLVSPNAWSFGGGFAVVEGKWKFFGETLAQITDHDLDQDYLMYSLGFSYRETNWANKMGLNEITYYLEYGGEAVLDKQKNRNYLVGNSYTYRQNLDTLFPKMEMRVSDTWSGVLQGAINLRDNDYTFGAGVEYKYSDNLKFRAGYTDFNGGRDTIYGNWDQNDVIKANLEYKF